MTLILVRYLLNDYKKIDSYMKLQKLLYKEIGKVSYIRDIKLKWVSQSVIMSGIITVSFIVIVSIFLLLSL